MACAKLQHAGLPRRPWILGSSGNALAIFGRRNSGLCWHPVKVRDLGMGVVEAPFGKNWAGTKVRSLEKDFGASPINCEDWCGIDTTEWRVSERLEWWESDGSIFHKSTGKHVEVFASRSVKTKPTQEDHNMFGIQVWHAMYEPITESLLHAQACFACFAVYIYIYIHVCVHIHTKIHTYEYMLR